MNFDSRLSRLAAAVMFTSLAACSTVGPDYRAPDLGALAPETLNIDAPVSAVAEEPASQWWQSMNDGVLNDLIARAFAENRDLRRALANVDAARAVFNLEKVRQRPQAQVSASAERRQITGATFGQDGTLLGDSDLYGVGLNATWELDFFGRVRRLTEAALADVGQAEALHRDAQALVAAETAVAYVDYRGAQKRLAVAQRNLQLQTDTLTITRARLEEGLGTPLDVSRAEAQVSITAAGIPGLEADATAAVNRLATLTGSTSGEIRDELARGGGELPSPPDQIAVGDVNSLIVRRADVRATERSLAAATARIGVAKADYYPRISFDGGLTLSSQTGSGLGDSDAMGYAVGPRLSWAGFDIPQVRARVNRAGADAEAALASYEQQVLIAVEDVQTALARYGREQQRFLALSRASAQASDAAALARERYDGGVDDFIDVLDAERQLLTAEAAQAESQVAVSRGYARVYLALGAGWTTRSE